MPRYQVTCHKDVYSPQVAYSLMKRYEELSGKDFIDTVKFIKFNYANVFNAFEALGITTQWYKSSFEKLKSSPHTKVDWKIFLPDIMRITKTDEKEAKEWLKYILSKVVTTQEVFQKEFFFKFSTLSNLE